MDIDTFKISWANLMKQMYVIDPNTGLPTSETVQAFAQAPMSLAETDMPTWIFYTGPATYPVPGDQTDKRLAKETRDFTASLYVAIVQQGNPGEAERKVQPYVDTSRNIIQKHVRLWDGNPYNETPGLQRAYLVRDTGVAVLRFGGTEIRYVGVSYTVRVEVLNEVIYARQ